MRNLFLGFYNLFTQKEYPGKNPVGEKNIFNYGAEFLHAGQFSA